MATTTVRALKAEARVLLRAGELGAALAAYEHVLATNPLDYGVRLKIADMIARLGDVPGAAALYRALAMHNMRAGHALPAIVACKELERLGQGDRRHRGADGGAVRPGLAIAGQVRRGKRPSRKTRRSRSPT